MSLGEAISDFPSCVSNEEYVSLLVGVLGLWYRLTTKLANGIPSRGFLCVSQQDGSAGD